MKGTSNQNTNFDISLEDPTAYATLAILTDPIKTRLNTNITAIGQTKPQTTLINIIAHTRGMIGRNYWQLLADPEIFQLYATTPFSSTTRPRALPDGPARK